MCNSLSAHTRVYCSFDFPDVLVFLGHFCPVEPRVQEDDGDPLGAQLLRARASEREKRASIRGGQVPRREPRACDSKTPMMLHAARLRLCTGTNSVSPLQGRREEMSPRVEEWL